MNLRIPGPTPCPPDVLAASAKEMINHRGAEFVEILGRVTANLKTFFQTQQDLLVLTCSGTGAMEAAIVNTLSPGDKVLAVTVGEFGDRFAEIAAAYGADVQRLSFEPGTAADPDAVRRALNAAPAIKAVLITHNETSTGVTNDLATLSALVKEFDKLLIVDATSSIGSIDLPVDAWRCDVVLTGSQKGWMAPPGLAMVSVSQEAWRAYREARMPRFYLDLGRAKSYLERNQTPWTPAVSVFFALDVALERMLREGLPNIVARHARVARLAREGVRSLGLSPLAKEEVASNTVTAVRVPEGVQARTLLQQLIQEHNVELAGGQGALSGKIFRIGHLGYVSEADVQGVIQALGEVLPKVGFTGPSVPASRS